MTAPTSDVDGEAPPEETRRSVQDLVRAPNPTVPLLELPHPARLGHAHASDVTIVDVGLRDPPSSPTRRRFRVATRSDGPSRARSRIRPAESAPSESLTPPSPADTEASSASPIRVLSTGNHSRLQGQETPRNPERFSLGNTESPAWGSVGREGRGGRPFLERSTGAGVHPDQGPAVPDEFRED